MIILKNFSLQKLFGFVFFVSLWTIFTDKHEILFYTTTFFLIRNAEYKKTLTLNVHKKSWRKTKIRMFQPHKFNQRTGFNPWRNALDLGLYTLEAVSKLQGKKYQRDIKGMVIKLRLALLFSLKEQSLINTKGAFNTLKRHMKIPPLEVETVF